MNYLNNRFQFSDEVKTALNNKQPVIALESTILAHGMPFPDSLTFAKKAESLARTNGVTPATIAILDGVVHVGLNDSALTRVAEGVAINKTASRDLPVVLSKQKSGATTVSATMVLAHLSGISVFATGGIGGVHRNVENTFDVSQDLIELGRTPVIVVSAGAKAILDLPKTLEVLESGSVSVLGYQTQDFPAFYSKSSGLPVQAVVESPEEIAQIYHHHCSLNLRSGLLVANPIPDEFEIPGEKIEIYIKSALKECREKSIAGKDVTPFLLKKIKDFSGGQSLKANIALALNNIDLGSKIAKSLLGI